jgi:hypothetical protein
MADAVLYGRSMPVLLICAVLRPYRHKARSASTGSLRVANQAG